jgi:CheY-like chemotaxis protein
MPESEKNERADNNSGAHSGTPSEREDAKSQWPEMNEGVILLAEDGEDQVMLIRRAFAKANFLNPLHVVSNGEEAIAYLEGEGKYASRDEYPLPTLLLLDLKMPRKDGFEVLEWIRQQPGLSALRVVVLTSSDEMRDVNRAYQLGANSFLVKPVDFPRFVEVTLALKGYWLWMSKEPEISREQRTSKR